jgi:sec-independent protein translocase protein TatB
MFGLGMGEILLIAVVALLAVGPDRLPQAARSIGRGIRDIRRQTTDLQQTLEQDSQIGDAVRELRSAWYGTAGSLPKNRYELGRALDQMTSEELPPAPKANKGEGDLTSATPGAELGGTKPAESPDPAGEDDDGLPLIKAPSGTIARGGTPAGDGAGETVEPKPAEAVAEPSSDPTEPPKPAHG